MRNNYLISSLLVSIFLLSNLIYAQPFGVGNWQDLDIWKTQPPAEFSNFLNMIGIPKELTVNNFLLTFYTLLPLLVFFLIIDTIVRVQVVNKMLGMRVFTGLRGWLLSLFLTALTLPTGWFGALALWLYTVLGFLAIYGFAILAILGVLIHFAIGGQKLSNLQQTLPWKWTGGAFVLIFVAFFLGGFGIVGALIVGLIITVMILFGYYKLNPPGKQLEKSVEKLGSEEQERAKALEWIREAIEKAKEWPASTKKDATLKTLRALYVDLDGGTYNENMKKRLSAVRDMIGEAL